MRRHQPGNAVRARAQAQDWDDETVVDFAAPDRARLDIASLHDAETVARPLPFDDLPTTIWTPRSPRALPKASAPPVSTRRLKSLADSGPSVRIAASHPAWSDRDEPTRIDLSAPAKPRPSEETTGPRKVGARASFLRRVSPVKLACVATGVIVLALLALGWHRRHGASLRLARPPVATSAPVAVAGPPAPRSTPGHGTPAGAVVTAAPVPTVAPPALAAPATDEVSAVDAVEAGDLRRAARAYAALAAANPGNEAYREAARILREATKEVRR